MRLRARLLRQFAIFAGYALVAVAITWPLIRQLDTHLFGDFLTDAPQTARHIWWINHALTNGESIFFQPAFNYPDGLPGAWLWANPLEYFPGWLLLFFVSLNAATNLTMLFHVAMNGYTMHLLLYELTSRNRAVALFGGLIFCAYPAIQSRIYGGHAGVVALWALPLFLLLAHRARETLPKWAYIVGGGFLALSIAGNSTLLVYYAAPVAISVLIYLLFTRRWIWFRRVFIIVTIGAVFGIILLLPLLLETQSTPTYDAGIVGSVTYSADLLSVVSPSFFHPLYDEIEYSRRALGTNLLEGTGYIGVIVALLATVGALRCKPVRWLILPALLVWLFSLGPLLKIEDTPVQFAVEDYLSYVPLPWGALQSLPILDISRTPGRFNLTLGLIAAIMATFGALYLTKRIQHPHWRTGVLIALSLIVFFDYRMFWPMPTRAMPVPQAIHDLRERDDIRAVFNMPVRHRLRSKDGLYMQAIHQHNIVAGQFIRDTPVSAAKQNLLQSTLDPALFDAAGVDVILLFRESDPAGLALYDFALAQLGTPIYEDITLALFNAPESDAEPAFTLTSRLTEGDAQVWSIYAPFAGWTQLAAELGTPPTNLRLSLNGETIYTFTGDAILNTPVFLPEDGYHELLLETSPRCPTLISDATRCAGFSLVDANFGEFVAVDIVEPVTYDNGIALNGSSVSQNENTITTQLAWEFENAPPDTFVRFVHIIGADGIPIVQDDRPLPVPPDASGWQESITLTLPDDTPPGDYPVMVGWYSFPDLQRFAINSGGDSMQIGIIKVDE